MDKQGLRNIEGLPSVFLDLLRITAALTVFLIHAQAIWYPETIHNTALSGDISHAAVVVFFVLSGYVISFTTLSKNRGGLQYTRARLSRLYSIVLPGLLITALSQAILFFCNPTLLESYTRDHTIVRYFITGAFLNEIWFLSSAPPINGPLWSLGYEFWFYVIFGVFLYARKKSFIILACVIAGPKILLMMPIWLLGGLAYKLPSPKLPPCLAWIVIMLLIGLAYLCIQICPPFPFQIGQAPFYWANQFLTDYLLGIIIFLMLWMLPNGKPLASISKRSFHIFREVADLTFPIYVLHMPLLILYRGLCNYKEGDSVQFLFAIIVVLCLCSFIGFKLNRSRPFWDSMWQYLLEFVKRKI